MSDIPALASLSNRISTELPFLRRHARALTGDQAIGDECALATLQRLRDDPALVTSASTVKVGLFRVFFLVWESGDFTGAPTEQGLIGKAQDYLQNLTPYSRQALLLHAIEGFNYGQIGEIMDKTDEEIAALIQIAHKEMKAAIKGRILVIEDESLIALDLEGIIISLGHHVTGTAATHQQAVRLAEQDKPDLILSDIQLADGSSGIDAVDEIMRAAAGTPVIFITAFPEKLLTGDKSEPAFVITKPYSQEQVQSAISQAMFFRSSSAISL